MSTEITVQVDPRLVDDWSNFKFKATVQVRMKYLDCDIVVEQAPKVRWDTPTVSARCTDPTRDMVQAIELVSEMLGGTEARNRLVGYNDVRIGNGSYWVTPNSSWLEDPTRWFPNGGDDDYKPSVDPVMGLRV